MDATLLGKGIYSLQAAARLIRADLRAVRRWMLGYTRRRNGLPHFYPPLWCTQFAREELREPVIGFRDLLELRMVNAFARYGVSLHVIRATIDGARQIFGTDYPLTTHRFRTDGRRVFMEALDRAANEPAEDEDRLLDVPLRQWVFSQIVRPALYAGIEFEGQHPRRWFLDKQRPIVLDPALQFGSPTVEEIGIPTDTLLAAYVAEGNDRNAVARIYGITPQQVMAAVRFEEKLAA
ncbi:MAG: DUF433 domain-containing protein [Pseudomonadota bacterium]